ncbi:MAG TPA: ADP-ribosylglycohydrolase family protein, partial [Candidatus Limnocylindria bacterium]|nr:ADP-ribosylglycohydrolase family protein [Candidatus Limnocylindria bacterium]
MHDPGDLHDLVADELRQRAESGHDVGSIAGDVRAALSTTRQPDDRVLAAWLDRLEATPRMPDWPFAEPQLAAEIEAALPIPAAPGRRALADDEQLADRIYGAWLGRTAGCMVGKPVEGWSHLQIRAYLEPMGAYPPDDYLPRAEPWPDTAPAMKPSWPST